MLSISTTNLKAHSYYMKFFTITSTWQWEISYEWAFSSVVHYNDVIMSAMASQITSFTIVYSTVYSGAGQRKHQSPASLAFVRGIHRWPVNSPYKWPVTRTMLPFDDVIMTLATLLATRIHCYPGILPDPEQEVFFNVWPEMALLVPDHKLWWGVIKWPRN